MGTLDGKVALISGAARGTGEATARLCVAEGARVVIGDLLDEPGQRVAKELGEAACFVHLDVSSEADWQRAVDVSVSEFGALNILVNNAAVLHMAPLADTELSDFERVVRVNQTGTFLGMKAVIEPMRAAGGGSIVNISSVDGRSAKNGVVAYAGSKWAVRGMTRVAALELGRFGIRVNAVCPEAGSGHMVAPYIADGVDPEVALAYGWKVLPKQRERTIAERIGDVARFVVFLASDATASCTGADFAIDGGNTAGSIVRYAPGA
jgi:3alpha(or 20beta)-hydroxysteroid dehydrogenase